MHKSQNPKIIHRIYFTDYAPFHDPYEHFLASWYREMPDYKIMLWGKDNLDVEEIEWTRRAAAEKQPVFLSEYFRWKVLSQYGGIYIDADCEIVNGKILHNLIEELYSQNKYDVFFGVEERENGFPTAQTFAGHKNAELIRYMLDLYQNRLAPLWSWRETRSLIGPQLISSYFLNKKINTKSGGHFTNLDKPVVRGKAKVYPQRYFSPKFTLIGSDLEYKEGETCVYHMFANANMDFSADDKLLEARNKALTFAEYQAEVSRTLEFPRIYTPRDLSLDKARLVDGRALVSDDGVVTFGPYITLSTGQYVVSWHFSSLGRGATVDMEVTADMGRKSLGEAVGVSAQSNVLNLPFTIALKSAKNVEFVLRIRNGVGATLERVTLEIAHSTPILRSEPGSLKILHRVYFGFDGKPDQLRPYLETWVEQLPDFKIMHWNATNLPMDCNDYVRTLFKEKDHAFLTDYFRWYILREYGGSYLDADVEVVDGSIYRSLIEELEASTSHDAFIGIDERGGGWYTAHSMASKPNSEISQFMCNLYENFGSFTAWRKRNMYLWAPQLVALYFSNRGHHTAGMGTTPHLKEPIVHAGVKIYPQDWFSPLSPSGQPDEPFLLNGLSDNTALCHHFACSWHDDDSFYAQHSKEKGGQAHAMIRDIVAAMSDKVADRPHDRTFDFANGLRSLVGLQSGGYAITATTAGYLAFGPYVSLNPGEYTARFEIHEIFALNEVALDVVASGGLTLINSRRVEADDLVNGGIEVIFAVQEAVADLEVRLWVGDHTVLAIRSLTISPSSVAVTSPRIPDRRRKKTNKQAAARRLDP